jgi:predicted nuclease of predicted toxin-antitoxin system
MKLLFDQNISFRVISKLADFFQGSGQVKNLGLQNNSDLEIWKFAKENNFSIVTFDRNR